jgi:hypothetical protein
MANCAGDRDTSATSHARYIIRDHRRGFGNPLDFAFDATRASCAALAYLKASIGNGLNRCRGRCTILNRANCRTRPVFPLSPSRFTFSGSLAFSFRRPTASFCPVLFKRLSSFLSSLIRWKHKNQTPTFYLASDVLSNCNNYTLANISEFNITVKAQSTRYYIQSCIVRCLEKYLLRLIMI